MGKYKISIYIFLSILLCVSSSNCLDDPVERAVKVIDRGIYDLETGSADWQTVLQNVANDLPKDISETVRTDAQNLATRSIATAGVEFRCENDFYTDRAIQSLKNLKAELLGTTPTPMSPGLCHVSPESIDLKTSSGSWSKVIFYGYDLDHKDANGELFKIFAIDNMGNRFPISEDRIGRTTHYQVTLNIGGLEKWIYEKNVVKFIFQWNGSVTPKGQIVVIPWQPKRETISSKSLGITPFMPPNVIGDLDFDTDEDNPMQLVLSGVIDIKDHYINSRVYMRARESESDYTTVEGWSPWRQVYQAPKGWKIIDVSPSASTTYNTNINHQGENMIFYAPAGEVVDYFSVDGDTDDDEAGTWTMVEVHWRTLRIELEEERPEWY